MLLVMALAVLVAQEPTKQHTAAKTKGAMQCPPGYPWAEPVVETETSWDSEYIHCRICRQGAMLQSQDEIVRCTYCGKAAKKDLASN